jgi:hypothetical protein
MRIFNRDIFLTSCAATIGFILASGLNVGYFITANDHINSISKNNDKMHSIINFWSAYKEVNGIKPSNPYAPDDNCIKINNEIFCVIVKSENPN